MKKLILVFSLSMMSSAYSSTNFVFFNDTCKDIQVTYMTAEYCTKNDSMCMNSFSLAANEPAFGGQINDPFYKISVMIKNDNGKIISGKDFYHIKTKAKENIAYSIQYKNKKIKLIAVPYDLKRKEKQCS